VPGILRYKKGAIEEDLLCLGLGDAVAPPTLFRVPLVPFEFGDLGEELRDQGHWSKYTMIIYRSQASFRGEPSILTG
jgi:hypothetical protein